MAITKISPSVVDFDAGITITTDDNSNNLTITSTDADANNGPNIKFHRNSGSPADNDYGGYILFNAENDASEDTAFSYIGQQLIDVSDGTEDGRLFIYNMQGGTSVNAIDILPTETVFNEGSVDRDFRVESNGNTAALFVDAGNDKVTTGVRFDFADLLIGTGAGKYIQVTGGSSNALAIGMDGGTAAPGTASTSMGFHHWNNSAWSNVMNVTRDGLAFGTDTAAANSLDDYEEGTWSVDLIGCDDNLSSPTGHYTKIGRLVYFYWYSGAFTISNQSGVAFIDGLPFTTRSNNGQAYSTFQYLHGDAVDGNSTGGYVEHAANKMRFIDAGTTDSASYVNGARYIMVSGIYEVA